MSTATSSRPSTAQEPRNENSLNDESVARYLADNPDFFRHHPNVLSEMSLPHHSGNATSLIERQVAILRERSIQTRHKLGELIEAARANDALFNTTQALVLKLLQADSLDSIFSTMESQLQAQFGVESTSTLLLCDEDIAAQTASVDPRFKRSMDEAKTSIPALIDNNHSLCGTLREHEAAFVFTDAKYAIGSAAIASRDITCSNGATARLILAVAHHSPSHYGSETGTLFLDYLGDILQVLIQREL